MLIGKLNKMRGGEKKMAEYHIVTAGHPITEGYLLVPEYQKVVIDKNIVNDKKLKKAIQGKEIVLCVKKEEVKKKVSIPA